MLKRLMLKRVMLKRVMLKRVMLALSASLWTCVASAVAVVPATTAGATPPVTPAVEKMVKQVIGSLSARAEVDSIAPSPLPGFYQVIASGKMIYIRADGRFVLNGDLLDLSQKANLNDAAWASFRKAELAKVPVSQRIVYAPAHPKYVITVFTDVNCGFCRALHEQVAAFNKAGIAVEYLAWPREGVSTTAGRPTSTYTEMVSVWCAPDRRAAFSAASAGQAPKPATCVNPVKDQFDLGLKLGVNGTPTIIAADGRVLGGYVTPEQLLQALR